MKLTPPALLARLPPLYWSESVPAQDRVAQIRFLAPWAYWSWLGVEHDKLGRVFYGLIVTDFETEFGSFSLDELEAVRGPGGQLVERDYYFYPTRLGDLAEFSGPAYRRRERSRAG